MIHTYPFADYRDAILALPMREDLDPLYQRDELITNRFLLFRDGPLTAYYAPFHYANTKARVALVGVTPGFTQMERAFRTARLCLAQRIDDQAIFRRVARASDFAGYMRKLLVSWLNSDPLPQKGLRGIGLNKYLGLETCDALFGTSDDLIHSTSVVSAPIFKNGENYTGHSPSLLRLPKFKQFITDNLAKELASMSDAVVIPLGDVVGEVIEFLHHEKLISVDRCLLGFPHPSGSNGHRFRKFAEGCDRWRDQLEAWFS